MVPYRRPTRLRAAALFTLLSIWACDLTPNPVAPTLSPSAQASGSPAATGAYELVPLSIGDLGFQVLDINSSEHVLLTVCCGAEQAQVEAAIWRAGALIRLGAPGPDDREGYDSRGFSYGIAINDEDAVTGFGSVGLAEHAFIWRPGPGMQDLGVLPGGTLSIGYGINHDETVVGLVDTPGGVRAFRWSAATGMVELPAPPGFDAHVYAVAINGAGVATGSAYSASGESRAVRWTVDGAVEDLGTLGGNVSYAVAIADDGVIAGTSTTSDGAFHAFRWTQAGGMERLDPGALFSQARDASRAGVLGVVNRGPATKDSTVSLQVLWTDPGGARVFRPPFATAEGIAVNDDGVIAGWADFAPVIWRPRHGGQP